MAEKDTDEKLDKIASHLDSLHKKIDAADEERKADRKRLDAVDEWRAKSDAAEKEREDKLRKDAEERGEKEREDRARKDAEEEEDEEREETDALRRDALKAGHKIEMRDDVEGFMEGGEFHPIRGSKGYKRSTAGEGRKSRRRHDAVEQEEQERKDRARKDAEEKEAKEKEEQEKNDRARNDSLAAEVAALKALIPAKHSAEDKNKFAAAQMKADKAYQAWGLGQAPPSLLGESLRDYRLRMAQPLKQYSRHFKDSALETIGDEGAFSTVEDSIINDAVTASISTVVEGAPLRMVTEKNESGHTVRKFYGDPAVTWGPMMGGAVRICKLQRPAAAK